MSANANLLAVGKVLLVVGVVGLVLGTAGAATGDCEPTRWLSVGDPDPDDPSGAVAFANLSPTEQRAFLEAYTDEDDVSRRYDFEAWNSSWFEGVRTVTYRDRRYGVRVGHSDCVPSSWGTLLRFGGGAVAFLGLWLFVPSYAWRRYS